MRRMNSFLISYLGTYHTKIEELYDRSDRQCVL